MTGRYPHCHGAYTNNIPLNCDEVTFAEVLRQHGYHTGYAGKWHLDGAPRPGWVHPDRAMGFEDARFMFNRGHWKKIEDSPMGDVQPTIFPYAEIGDQETYTSDWLTNKTLNYLESVGDDPFCYMLSLPDPHPPVEVRAPYDTLFAPENMPLPKTFHAENLPDWAQDLQSKSPFGLGQPNREENLRRFLALYFGEVKLIDDCVGRITKALKSHGKLENTIVIFTSDHGEYAGEHGLMGKNHLFETAYRVPFIMQWPAGITPASRIDRLMTTVDVQPTLLSLMGVPASGREQGRDGSCQLKGTHSNWDDVSHIHHNTHAFAGVFTPEYELALAKRGDSVLFDRKADPDQTRNLYADPAHQDIVDALSRKVIQHHIDVKSPAADWLSVWV